MIRFNVLNRKTMLRALVVAVTAGVACAVVGMLTSNLLDNVWRITNSDLVYTLFYALSSARDLIIAGAWLVVMALFANWILYPSYLAFSQAVTQSLEVSDAPASEVRLPKAFKGLQDELEAMSSQRRLWMYIVKEAEKRKDDLVVYLAHDIRTPLTSVLGYLELLAESPDLPEAQKQRYTDTALRKAERMQTLVEELFEVTRYNVSQIELRRQNVNLGMMVNQLVEEMQPVLAGRNLAIEVEGAGQTVFIDPEKLARALDNVLHNAAYYSPEGETVRVHWQADGEGNGLVEVSNTGAEISQAELDRYFEKFYRGDGARGSRAGGSGLGLAIAKSNVEAHGGSISAHNANRVTTFTILLPKL
ncbi:HAMP domain-containing histidine kinase [Ruminococcaceae bacterium OttesenSCG-928-A11]|nr:HAMP domain-containing histidine kinase [Ruminococcaceae bacterium OttesenSCG-928-A11]